jgi:phosphonopyruvate decarboxylase
MKSKDFLEILKELQLNSLAGVPDSGLRDFLIYVENHADRVDHVRCANEGQAVGVAAGYYLATKQVPIVYLQNSGLGNTVNPLTSLADKEVYGIPMILFVAWRGKPGEPDEPQHSKMGRVMLDMLNVLEIPFEIAQGDGSSLRQQLTSLKEQTMQTNHPVALVFPKGVFEEEKLAVEPLDGMKREEALEILLEKIGLHPIVATTGYTSREIFEIREKKGQSHELDFLSVGSMGHASSIALGIARQSKKQVYIIDGDGAISMHMGCVATIGSYAPENLYHIVIDNGVHESTGGQPTVSRHIEWKQFFESVGYKSASVVSNRQDLEAIDVDAAFRPAALVIKVVPGTRKDLGRPTKTPGENREAFMKFLES